jgi:hypothetical protein
MYLFLYVLFVVALVLRHYAGAGRTRAEAEKPTVDFEFLAFFLALSLSISAPPWGGILLVVFCLIFGLLLLKKKSRALSYFSVAFALTTLVVAYRNSSRFLPLLFIATWSSFYAEKGLMAVHPVPHRHVPTNTAGQSFRQNKNTKKQLTRTVRHSTLVF